ncbi:MAG TPA: tRNA (guanosine(46)-N7)-methyltransferase TrmB [Methylomirabilota bacterium]|nr:tRNA (guanosine(46)-N7)-methyltransferase TrmB [Methylomirabilota bacterium]
MNTAEVKIAAASTASLIYRPVSFFQPLELAAIFPDPRPLEIELGAGDGTFLATWATQRPGSNFLGIERLLGRLRKLDRKARRLGLRNLRLMRIEAGYFLNYLLPLRSVAAIHVYFPDPWPKRKHRKHRLVNTAFVATAARVLQPGGRVHLRTDDADYFAQMRSVFAASPNFYLIATEPELLAVKTDFETEFNARGIPTNHATYQLVPR